MRYTIKLKLTFFICLMNQSLFGQGFSEIESIDKPYKHVVPNVWIDNCGSKKQGSVEYRYKFQGGFLLQEIFWTYLNQGNNVADIIVTVEISNKYSGPAYHGTFTEEFYSVPEGKEDHENAIRRRDYNLISTKEMKHTYGSNLQVLKKLVERDLYKVKIYVKSINTDC